MEQGMTRVMKRICLHAFRKSMPQLMQGISNETDSTWTIRHRLLALPDPRPTTGVVILAVAAFRHSLPSCSGPDRPVIGCHQSRTKCSR